MNHVALPPPFAIRLPQVHPGSYAAGRPGCGHLHRSGPRLEGMRCRLSRPRHDGQQYRRIRTTGASETNRHLAGVDRDAEGSGG